MLEKLIDSLLVIAEINAKWFHVANRFIFGRYYVEDAAPFYAYIWLIVAGFIMAFTLPTT